MFTGIVEAVGRIGDVRELETTRRFRVEAGDLAGSLEEGTSIAVDGACLTVTEADEAGFSVDVVGTTLGKTIARHYQPGARVNLERALRADGRLEGHLVQGHVDGIGHLVDLRRDGEYWLMDFSLPDEVADLTVRHGSLAVNGVSLTVSDVPKKRVCRIGVIPFTWEHTNLGALEPADPVNVEGDLIGKYVGKMLAREVG